MRDDAKSVGLSIQFRSGGLDLTQDEEKLYAPIGYAIVRIARLEYDIEQFAFRFAETDGVLCRRISPKFPDKLSDKVDFLAAAFSQHPSLRLIEDASGVLDPDDVQNSLEMVFWFCNLLAHGSAYSTHTVGGKTTHFFSKRSSRRRKLRDRKGTMFRIEDFKIDTQQIDYVLKTVLYLSSLVTAARRVLDGVDIWKEAEELRQGRTRAREMIEALRSSGSGVEPWVEQMGTLLND